MSESNGKKTYSCIRPNCDFSSTSLLRYKIHIAGKTFPGSKEKASFCKNPLRDIHLDIVKEFDLAGKDLKTLNEAKRKESMSSLSSGFEKMR
jgi:hypothetical protein